MPVKSRPQQYRESKQRRRQHEDIAEKNRQTAVEGMKRLRRERQLTEETDNYNWPPDIDKELKVKCLQEFSDALSSKALKISVCAICGIESRDTETMSLDEIPNKHKLMKTHSNNVLDEYNYSGYILDKEGIHESKLTCCKDCLRNLQQNQLPACSVANQLQFGTCPPELENLTIVEKTLIAAFRTSLCVIKFKEIAGTGTEQKGLRGNSISFPQDIECITSNLKAEELPNNENNLTDTLKVVYVGSKPPTKRQLQNVLQVRRKKVMDALRWLKEHHKQYSNIKINQKRIRKLPKRGIPPSIWQTILHSDDTGVEKSSQSGYVNENIENVIRDAEMNNEDDGDIVMGSSGVIDVDVSSLTSLQESTATARHLIENTRNAEDHEEITLIPHGPDPVCEYRNPEMWTGGYPWLFPYGTGGPEEDRKVNLSFHKWMKYVLNHRLSRFRLDHAFQFHIFNVLQKRNVCLHTSMIVKQPKFADTADKLSKLSSKQIENAISSLSDRKMDDPAVKLLLDQVQVVGKHLPGSPYAKKPYRMEIHGQMISLGMPAIYITLNPADIHHPLVSFFAGEDIDLDALFPEVPPPRQRAKLVSQQPIACAKFFDTIVKAFLDCILRFGKEEGGVFGRVSGYFGTVEEQGRGSLHLHMLIWLDGYRSPTLLREKMRSDPEFKDRVLKFLEETIKQHSPFAGSNNAQYTEVCETDNSDDLDLEEKLTERKPNEDSTKDTVLTKRPPTSLDSEKEINEELHQLVRYCNIHKCNTSCFKNEKVKICRYHYPRPIQLISVMDGDEIIIKRLERLTNNYEEITMLAMRCNHDCQFVGSGKASRAAAFYITDYQVKSGLTTHNILPIVSSAIRNMELETGKKLHSDAISKSKMMIHKCINRIASHRELSAVHVAHILLGNEDKYSSPRFKVLNVLSFLSLVNDVVTSDIEIHSKLQSGNDGIVLLNDSCDYMYRGPEFEEYSLYEYTSWIEKVTITSEESNQHSETGKGRPLNKRGNFTQEHPQCLTHMQKKRSKPVTPRLTYFPPDPNSNKEKFALCMLILFKPFTDVTELKGEKASWGEEYDGYSFSEDHQIHISNIMEMHAGLAEKKSLDEERNAMDDEEDTCEVIEDYYYAENEDDEIEIECLEVSESSHRTNRDDTRVGVSIICDAKQINTQESTDTTNQSIAKEVSVPVSKGLIKTWQKVIAESKKSAADETKPPTHNPDDTYKAQNPSLGYEDIVEEVRNKFTLNAKQNKAFKLMAENVWKRLHGIPVSQKLVYLGGEGATGKSQVIKALKHFHEILGISYGLKVSAYTGTASAEIQGNTLSSLAKILRKIGKKSDMKKL